MNSFTISMEVNASLKKVWNYWTSPDKIRLWNFASDDWCCPNATNELKVGGEFHYAMEAKDGSMKFDFWGTYLQIQTFQLLDIRLGDGRKLFVRFEEVNGNTIVTETIEPEKENTIEIQKTGWTAILTNFKKSVESH